MSDPAEEFRQFLGDPSRPAADVESLSDQEFSAMIDGRPLDVGARAAELRSDADARALAEFTAQAKAELISKGYDPDTNTWVRPAEVVEDVTADVPDSDWYAGPDGQPVQAPQVSPQRWAHYADNVSEVGQMSDAQFSAFLEAREAGRPVVFKEESLNPEDVNDVFSRLGGG